MKRAGHSKQARSGLPTCDTGGLSVVGTCGETYFPWPRIGGTDELRGSVASPDPGSGGWCPTTMLHEEAWMAVRARERRRKSS